MITAIVLYDLPPNIGLEKCRAHFSKIAPDFLRVDGFVRKQFICSSDGRTAGGVYMWKDRAAAERFYNGPWRAGIIERYGNAAAHSIFRDRGAGRHCTRRRRPARSCALTSFRLDPVSETLRAVVPQAAGCRGGADRAGR